MHAPRGLFDAPGLEQRSVRDRHAYIEIDGCDPQQTKCISGTLNPEWNETRGPASLLPITFRFKSSYPVSHRFTFKIDKPMSKELKVKVRRRRQ